MTVNEAARLGGLKGGPARAKSLTPERRKQIAKLAANKRWGTVLTNKERFLNGLQDEINKLQRAYELVSKLPDEYFDNEDK